VPAPLGWTDDGLVFLAGLPGRTLRQELLAGDTDQVDPDDVIGILDALPTGLAAGERRRTWGQKAPHYASVLAATLPGIADRARVIAAAVHHDDPEGPDVTVHGDLYENQAQLPPRWRTRASFMMNLSILNGFRLLPQAWRTEIIEGLLGSSLIGFHTQDYAGHFLTSVLRTVGHEHQLGNQFQGARGESHLFHVDIEAAEPFGAGGLRERLHIPGGFVIIDGVQHPARFNQTHKFALRPAGAFGNKRHFPMLPAQHRRNTARLSEIDRP
jgi:hypothetical protein